MGSFNEWNKQNIIKALALCLIGVILLCYPQMATNLIAYGIAAFFVVNGIVHIVGYFKASQGELSDGTKTYSGGLVIGIISIIFAILIGKVFVAFIPVVLGIIVVVSGLIKLQQSVDMIRFKEGNWLPILIMAIITIVIGALAIFNPFDTANLLFRILGIGLVFGGVTDLISTKYVSGKLK